MARAGSWGSPRRRLLPGWVWLFAALAVLLAGVYYPWRGSQGFADVTFRLWTCPAAPTAGATWSPAGAGCTPSVRGLQLQLLEGNGPREAAGRAADAVVFGDVSTAAVDFSLQVELDDPAEQVLLHPAAHGEDPLSAFHPDASGRHWTSYWRPSGRSEFDLLVVPAGGSDTG